MTKTLAEFKTELKDLLVVALRAEAKAAGIAGYSKMRKAELVDLLASERILRQAFEGRARRAVKAPAVDQNELCRDCDHPRAKHYADVACDNGDGGKGFACPCRGFKSRDEDPLLTPDFDEEAVYAQATEQPFKVGDIVRHREGSARERRVVGVHDTEPLVLLNDGGNVWVATAHLTHDVPKVEIHTGGELHLAAHPIPVEGRVTFTFNLSRLLDDPLRKPDADLVKRDGTDHRMQDFVFCTEGALDLYKDMCALIERQIARGKSVAVLVLCRGGKHRSVAFGENLAAEFDAFPVKHHHIDLPIVKYAKTEASK